jgi:hypothetical protein
VHGQNPLAKTSYDRQHSAKGLGERELAALNKKPLTVAYRNTGTRKRALRKRAWMLTSINVTAVHQVPL